MAKGAEGSEVKQTGRHDYLCGAGAAGTYETCLKAVDCQMHHRVLSEWLTMVLNPCFISCAAGAQTLLAGSSPTLHRTLT